MTGAFVIARHEVAERWRLWPLALGLGWLPLLPARLVGDDGVVTSASLYGLMCASWIAAIAIGMSLIGRPLHDGQLAFYFARPIRGAAIAGGKLLGGVIVVAGIELVLCAPVAAHFGSLSCVALAMVPAALCFGMGLAAGVLVRSRSRWFLADAVGLGGFALELRWITALDVYERDDRVWYALIAAGIAALFAAALTSVAVGRTDRERAHAALSLTLWPILIAASAVIAVAALA
ncbi:MAG TPA: hypothetical protein VHW23_32975 [Kofleriaceae bacterium]|nr:hypothetical protein [Kofleriaceae bacterium]